MTYAAMNDPERNPQFRRRWTEPPPQKRRKGPAAATRGPLHNMRNGNDGAHNSRPLAAVKPIDRGSAL
jgi:hypothetical protein